MSAPRKDIGEGPKRPPESPQSPSSGKLRETVRFYEKVWTGTGSPGIHSEGVHVDVEQLERKLAEERARHQEVAERTEPSSPRHEMQYRSGIGPDGSFQESFTTTTEEGNLASGVRTVKIEKVTVSKKVRHISSSLSTQSLKKPTSSRTPSEERLDDSDYLTQSNGNLATTSKTSSQSSLTGRFPSEDSLGRPSSRQRDEGDSNSSSSKVTNSSSEWYSEYRTQSFHSGSSKLEYVRSKSQYEEHIDNIRDEQERVQKKTFVNWINSYLLKRVPPLKVEDLIEDLKDGTRLLALLEVLSGERLPVERGRVLRRPHFLSNANTALRFLQSKRIKLVNINASDVVDGRPPVVLGLIWTIILYFQIEENTRNLEYLAHWGSSSSLESAGTTSSRDKWKQGARKTLLNWVANALPDDAGIEVKDFGASWRDGIAFLAIIDAIKKNLVNIAELKKASNRARLETAFDVAESELGIPKILDPVDVDVPKPDEKSIMTYVAQFLHRYPEPKATGPDAIVAIQEQYSDLLSWLIKKTQYLDHLQQTNSLPENYLEYAAFKAEVDDKSRLYNKLKHLIESQSPISIAKESWFDITKLWDKLRKQLLFWLWLLDSTLPGDLRVVGEWLARAEKLLYCDEIPDVMNEETATIISRKLEEHKAFFVDLPAMQQKFMQAYQSPLANQVPSDQLSNMAERLNDVGPKAAQRRVRLKFLEHKCCLIAFLQLTETKLRAWTAKYGRVDKVVQLLDQYRNFVSKNHIFQEFNKAFRDMQAVIDEYKRDGNIDKKESMEIDSFMRDTAERWKNVSMELRCVQSMLEEVVAYWKRWDSLAPEFGDWLNQAEKAINLDEEEKMEFFQDITVYRDKYQLLGDTVSFLMATVEDGISLELRDAYQNMTDRWDKIYPYVNKYSHAGDILRNRKDFRAGVEVLSNWLRKAEGVLSTPCLGSMDRVKLHRDNLIKLQSEVEEIENLFKNISKAFQTLIQDLSRDEVDKMMNILKQEKEALVKVRALIPAQINLFNQLLIQQESLESGKKEINSWLDNAEVLLTALTLEADKEQLKDQLDKIKHFFTRTLYYKSMLESKNKMLTNIVKLVDNANNPDVIKMVDDLDQINERFTYVTQNAQLWEQRLQEAIRCWHNFSESERVISNWLNSAEKLIAEKHIDNKGTVEEHKNFFESVNERWIHDLVQSAQELCNCLPKEQHAPILSSVHHLQNKWREVLSFAPLHLMRLEFRLDENTFNYYVKELEKEVQSEHLAINKSENVESVIARHKEFFGPQGPLRETKQSLANLQHLAEVYSQNCPEDKSLKEAVEKAEHQWTNVNVKIDNVQQQLERIPQKWDQYRAKFNDMVRWMDGVDSALKNILTDVNTPEEFEREIAAFRSICQDADKKRDDMKWLVQTLDYLASHCPEHEALAEQKTLENLILRYKNLIPSLEITMTKTETMSKCYTYRREVRQICELLKQVREQTSHKPQVLEKIDESVRHQEMTVSHLDEQRPLVMTMLQRGKELTRDAHAPSFVADEVKTLESGWTQTYSESVSRLQQLVTTQQTYRTYQEHRRDINKVLERVERDLTDSKQLSIESTPTDLISKQQHVKHLQEVRNEIAPLRELTSKLSQDITAPQKAQLEKDVLEVEKRLETTTTNIQEQIALLQHYKSQWTSFQSQLGQLKEWSSQEAPQLLSSVRDSNIAPEERVEKTQLLQSEISKKEIVLEQLTQEASKTFQKESADAQTLKSDIVALQDRVSELKSSVQSQAALVSQDLENWKTYKASLEKIAPAVQKVELKVQSGLPKPATLEEAIKLQSETKNFTQECQKQLQQLKEIEVLAAKLDSPDEVDSVRTRLFNVQETTTQWSHKLEKLISSWVELDKNVQHLENWVSTNEKVLSEKPVTDVDKLEKELIRLKQFNNEVSEQQGKLIALTQSADNIAYQIAPEGASVVKDQIQTLKTKVTDLAQGVRGKINQLSDAILARHDFQAQVADFSNWLDSLNANTAQLDEVPANKIESAIENVHSLLQEHAEKQPLLQKIYDDVKEITLKTTKQENEPLNAEYSHLVQVNQEVEHNLQSKMSSLQKWSELLNWHTDSVNQLKHLKYQVENENCTPEKLKDMIKESNTIVEKIISWKQEAPKIDATHSVIILDKQTGLPTTAEHIVREVEIEAINLKSKLSDNLEKKQKVKSHWNDFTKLQEKLLSEIGNTKTQLEAIKSTVKHSSDLPHAVEKLNNLLQSQQAKSATKEELRRDALQLMKEDAQQVGPIQNAVSDIEGKWNKVNEDIKEERLHLSDIIQAWNEFQESKDQIVTEIGKIDKSVESLETPQDLIQANVNAEKAKKAQDAIKKTKTLLDRVESKGQTIIRKTEKIPGIESEVKRDLQIVNNVWSKIYEKIVKTVNSTESQSTIWRHIDETKTTLLQWLSTQNNAIVSAAQKPNETEVAAARLAKYKEELPAHQRLFQSIPHKYEQLVKFSDGKEVPTLQTLIKVLKEQFTTVAENASTLEQASTAFEKQEKAIRDDIKTVGTSLSSLREEVIKCEDFSGDNVKILERLVNIKVLEKDLENQQPNLGIIDENIRRMTETYSNFGESSTIKEQEALKKRYKGIVAHANKVDNALSAFLKKFHNDKYAALQRIITTQREKIQWCLPDTTSDKYNLQVKLGSLNAIDTALDDCQNRMVELENSLKMLGQVESPESLRLLTAEKDYLLLELNNLKQEFNKAKEALTKNIDIQGQYEDLADKVNNWLKDVENKVKSESSVQMDLDSLAEKREDIKRVLTEVQNFQPEINRLSAISDELIKDIPDTRVPQYVQHLNSRYQSLNKFLQTYLSKLDELDKYQQIYRNSVKDLENWLDDVGEKVKRFSKTSQRPNQAILEELKKFNSEKEKGQLLLGKAVSSGEALFSGITPENRDAIRTELRTLRTRSEDLIGQVNQIYKNVENSLTQRHSFDDSLQQVNLWLTDINLKLTDQPTLDATLSEKKQTLYNYKTIGQDINLHKNILQQLQEKLLSISDGDSENKLKQNVQVVNQLASDVSKRIELSEDYVSNHESYNQAIEKCHDWLSALTAEAALLVDESSSEPTESKLTIVENLLAQKDEGDKIIEACRAQLQSVLVQTAPEGHPPLINSFQDQLKSWNLFLELCTDAKEKLNIISSQFAEVGRMVDTLDSWLKSKENQVKDQSLKNTEEAKRTHLDKLRVLEKEIISKEPEFANFTDAIKNLKTDAKVSQLNTRYQSLKNAIKENILRYDGFVKDHSEFNKEYAEFLQWISDKAEQLQDLCHIVGDLNVLQQRQNEVRNLIDEKNRRSVEFEDLIEKGEKLYVHTSPDGREIIRQQLRNIRTIWDSLGDDLQIATNKLDQCILQFSDFAATQEQLTKWLKDVEKGMKQHTELKSTLQEKRAQLQNHKIMHQEIMSHQQLVETVCDRAQHLVDQTQDQSLNAYLQSIKLLFSSIVAKSEELLQGLEDCVEKHQDYNKEVDAFRDWLTQQNLKLSQYDNEAGDKVEIAKRIENLKALKSQSEDEGLGMLEGLKSGCVVVGKSTAPKGVDMIRAELAELQGQLLQHLSDIDSLLDKQHSSIEKWDDYEKTLENLNQWLQKNEAAFRNQPLQASLPEKVAQLAQYQQKRQEIEVKEKEVDQFIDRAHALLRSSGVQKIKPVVTQFSVRYQNLLGLSKDALDRWGSIVDDHKKYQQKLEDTLRWLQPLEDQLATLQRGELADNPQAVAQRMQILRSEKEQGEPKIGSLSLLAERILPDTAMPGRETIRNELKDVRERWEKLSDGIIVQQKHQEAQTLQLSSYKDMLQQTLAWLETMEKQVKLDISSWTSIQDVRGKLLKQKTSLQEIVPYKRVVDGITEKASSLIKLTNNKDHITDIENNIESINQRYDNLLSIVQNNIKQLESCLESYQQFYDLLKTQQDNQKQLWDTLNCYVDYSGNKPMIAERLSNVNELEDSLPEVGIKLKELENYTKNNISMLPARAQEAMQRDVANLKADEDKFHGTLVDVKSALENRLKQWNDYEISMERLMEFLKESEQALKSYEPKSTEEEKKEQFGKYQALITNLKQNKSDFDKISDDSAELVLTSGDTRICISIQQITSRFQSVQGTAKEIVKKCEQAYTDHKTYNEKYKQCLGWLASARAKFDSSQETMRNATQATLSDQAKIIEDLLAQKTSSSLLLNGTIEAGEKLYPATSPEGREIVAHQLEELQQAFDSLFDEISLTDRDLKAKLNIWSEFDSSLQSMERWGKEIEKLLPQEIELRATLEEKKQQLQAYRNLLHDVTSHQQNVVDLRSKVEHLPEKNEHIEKEIRGIADHHGRMVKRAQNFVERYEQIVSDHQRFDKAVQEICEWVDSKEASVILWGDINLERVSLLSNLERLKKLAVSIEEDESKLANVKSLSDQVIPNTIDHGQSNIRSQVDTTQQQWVALVSNIEKAIIQLEAKLQNWQEYEKLRDGCLAWMKETDSKLHSIDLKPTLPEKEKQLGVLKNLQGEIKAKELEIDQVTERIQQLNQGFSNRPSQISELGVKYQQICQKVKEQTSKWQQYVNTHHTFNNEVEQCEHWLEDLNSKLSYCAAVQTATQKELENKLETIQGLILNKEEGFSTIQKLVELAQSVLANTAPEGHDAINHTLANLQSEWSNIATNMIETKALIEDALRKWAGLLEEINALDKKIENLESQYNDLSQLLATASEKKTQLDRIKSLEEKVRCEKIEVDALKAQAADILKSKSSEEAAIKAKEMLDRFDDIFQKIQKLLHDKEQQYKDHKTYKEAYEEVQVWMTRAQEKVPQLKQRPIGDKLSIETFSGPLDHLLNKQAQGEVLLENLEHTAQVVIPNTNAPGQEAIKNEIRALRESFERLFKDLKQQREQLEVVLVHWRDYKDEFEKISDWLQQISILIKNQKIALSSTLDEKEKQVKDVKDILQNLVDGRGQVDKLNDSAKTLLKSPLETHVNNQLQQLNSRYQVELNTAKDVLKKVETNYEQHKEYVGNLEKARNWIDNARDIISECSEAISNSNKDNLQQHLDQIQDLIGKREEGQSLVHATVNCGEKVLRNTRSDGRDAINDEIKEVQSDWERIVKKMSTVKVNLETALLQWADYDSSYNQLQQWISEREAKLQQVTEPKAVKVKGQGGLSALPIGERKATLRETGSIVQDIVSFEPMIQSVTSKAEDLKQAAPASEISSKYETLTKQAREIYAKQKATVEQHQAFVDAANDFVQWIRLAKEKLGKCAEPMGDKEALGSKLSQVKILHNELPIGQKKLETALEEGDKAYQDADDVDKEIIEEEVALLQDEFDNYVEQLGNIKSLLENGIVKWTEYEEQFQDALKWLGQQEKIVQSFNKLQDSLEEKRAVLEQFQLHLQTLFDWQSELDRLNMKAQQLLETCADSRVSNAIMQLSTKYNAILSMAKEIMRRLELYYQEHQQHSALYQECQDWIDRTRDKLNGCTDIPNTLAEINNKLLVVKNIRTSIEQGQNTLRYINELKERVIMNTEQSGVGKIQEDTDNLKQDMEKLVNDVNDLRNKLQARASQLEEGQKLLSQFLDWLQDQENQMQFDDLYANELHEKKAKLEKYKQVQKEITTNNGLLEKLQPKNQEDNSIPDEEIERVTKRYENLREKLQKAVSDLEVQVEEHDQYKTSYNKAVEWIRRLQLDIQSCSNLQDELPQIIEKEAKAEQITSNLGELDDLVNKTIKMSIDVMKTTGEEGKDTIRDEIEQLNSEWEGLQYICSEVKKNLGKCKEAWKDFKSSSDAVAKSIQQFSSQVETERSRDNKKQEDLERCKALLAEIESLKPNLETLSDSCEILMELSAVNWVRDKTVQLQSTYTNLLTDAQSLVSKVEKNLSDHTEFLNAKIALDEWLQAKHAILQQCVDIGSESDVKAKLIKVQLLSASLDEGQKLLSNLQDAFAKVINTASSEKQNELRESTTALRNSWDQLNMESKSIEAKLKAALTRWAGFNEAVNTLQKWLNGVEKSLAKVPNTKGELSEMKTVLERYKHLQDEISKKREDLNRITVEARELSALSEQPEVLLQISNLEVRFESVSSLCKSLQDAVDAELQEYIIYQQKLQDTEKWLLQVSFQLMAHNSLYITNREQTEEQIAQHEVLLKDIQNYRSVIDDVKDKGSSLIDKYVGQAPAVKDNIERQLVNVQDSYNSLLQTALQIKSRLEDSLAKFKQYEDTLESIMKNLDEYEPIVDQELDRPIDSLKEANEALEVAKSLHAKLQAEKNKLAVAVQACEDATASISRPSSPKDALPPPVPIKELECRARLEDLIDPTYKRSASSEDSDSRLKLLLDQLFTGDFVYRVESQINKVQAHLSDLASSITQLEEIEKQKGALKSWIEKQEDAVKEWKNRPNKLRADAAKQDLNAMNELLANISQRRNQLTTELSGPSGTDETLSKSLDKLEKNLMSVIADKQAKQEIINQYKQQLQAINTWFDNLNKRIDAVDKGSGLNCQQKQAALAEIQEEFDELGPSRLEELKRLASRVADIVHNLDSQQVEEQVKSADRRYNDISKKLQRKAQVLEMTRKGIDGAKTEIDEARNWVKDKFNDLQKTRPISLESYKVEEGLISLKDLLKDAENKVILKDSLLKRVNDMSNELEPSEHSELESSLKNLGGEQADLVNKIKQEIARLNSAAETRRNFEADLLKAKTWLKNKNSEVRKLSGYLPLQANQVEKEIAQYKAYDGQIKQFSEADLKNLLNAGNSILKECDEGDRERLQHLLDEVQEEYNGLTQESKLKLEALTDLLQGRKQFEGDIDKVVNWLKEAEVATSTDIRLSNLEVLDEQLAKYEKLIKDSEQVGEDIGKISEQGKAILPTISESDKITLKETLNNLKERHNRIDSVIKERTEDLRRNIQQIKEAQARLAESLAFVKEVQNQLHELNKPLGSRVEDVQNVLSAYERILKDVKADKSKLSTVPGANATELQVILNMQEDLIKSIEDQISKLKQLLLLREQYLTLITEIMTFITKYTEIVRDVEKTGGTIEEKIKKYDDIIIKIQECEALHASATDKGLQIAQDCNVQDRNEITEQLQALKQSLNNLRKAVEKQRQEHENTAAEYKKLASELEEILDWLHTNEGSVKSRPLLSRDIGSINKEISKHDQLNKDVNDHLDKLRKIQNNVENDDSLPGSLQEQLSEANSLINSLPRELQEQAKYLEDNKKFREEYDQLKEKLYAWIKEADSRLNLHKDGVDFENIFTALEEHKIFFGAESGVKEIAFHGLQQAADKIWPSLTPYEQEELSREQQHHTQTFKNTVNSAKSQKAQLEQDAEIWKGYLKVLDKVKALIARSKFSDEPVATLAGLQFNIQKITHAINDIQNQVSELDLLHTRVSELSKEANEHNRAQIQHQSDEVTKEWSTLVSNLEGRKDSLTKLADVWGSFEGKLQNFERSLSGIEDRTKHIDQVVRNKDHVVTTRTQIEELYTEASSLKSQEKDVLDHSKVVLLFLGECSPESASALSKKLDQLINSYQRLLDNLKEKRTKVEEDLAAIEKALRDVTQKKSELVDLKSEIIDFYVFDEDLSRTEKELRKLSSQVQSRINDARQLSADLRSKYQAAQNLVPSDIAQELNQLELLTEGVVTAMEDKEREFKKAKTIRTDYLTDVEELQNWIKDSELKIQDRSVTPQQLHEKLQQIYSEIGSITDKLDKVIKNGKTIIEKSRKQDEKDIVQSTIDNLTDQISQVKSSLEEKRDQVGDILDAWQRFLALYELVIQWTEERRIFLQEPLNVSSLQDVKQRLHDYHNAVKSCKGATKNLSDMVKELEYISTVTTVGDLPKKMEHAEEVKTEVEAQILERNALLQETSEEWEQCEKKMKEARTWAEKARTALESPQNKKKPLRDQHAIREKMLADIHIQKTKISLSIEKLQLHFRSGIKADTKITESVSELLQDLDGLEDSIKGQVTQLEKAILQVEGYQGEVQQLRQQIVQVEQQLRTSMAPNYKPHDRDGATREQEGCRERIRGLQHSLSLRNERVKRIVQLGVPDLEPLDT
ncbi:muscle-specific protein 300 kDa isoform X10 [Euwallacea fornicatus]|uniref:muscle-specific protein 300 kDa isoform X10 n=1 Tax=Euwallacea fornicatus TaxID=995702 RepID=UPI00338E26EE